jgi:2-polyprenyl-6-methoxyphenol hydroxylase-like FAD-dependent oxidoreductase
MTRVLIIEAGIGGLTTAIGIHRSGIEAVVLEQTAELREIGSAIPLA